MSAIFAGLACASGAVLGHVVICRWLRASQYIAAAMLCLFAGMLCGCVVILLSGVPFSVDDWLLFLVLVPSLMSTYVLIFFGVGWDSPTLALVNFILDHGPGGMMRGMLDDFIRRHPFVDSRLDAMIQAGVVTEERGMLHARADVGLAVRLAEAYRRLCGVTGMAG